jgi:prepilin-type N-terminal cleavage/methylation domain-containing protein
MKSLKKGFTLVELMVVIVIIGILAALAIPRFLGASNKAKATEFKPVLKQIYTLQEAYKQEKDAYGSTAAMIAFDTPTGGNPRFTYTVVIGTGTNLTVGKGVLKTAGTIKKVSGADMTTAEGIACANAGTTAATNGVGALDSLAVLASVPVFACD